MADFTTESNKIMAAIGPQRTPLSKAATTIIGLFTRDYTVATRTAQALLPTTPILIRRITTTAQIMQPQSFPMSAIPHAITAHIKSSGTIQTEIRVSEFSMGDGHYVSLLFYLEKAAAPSAAKIAAVMVRVLTWLVMIYQYKAQPRSGCPPPRHLRCLFYLTSLKKTLPAGRGVVLSEINANTAFTRTCAADTNEIVVYRSEEWFKVFIHETIHTFGLDFSGMGVAALAPCSAQMRDLFGVNSTVNVNLYEAYTEFWAEVINALFCAAAGRNPRGLLGAEAAFGRQQMHKVLRHMGLNYADLVAQSEGHGATYKEGTSILAYYIIKNILLTSDADFFAWVLANHRMAPTSTFLGVVDFPKTQTAIKGFCQFITEHNRVPRLLHDADSHTKTMRMTACELQTF